jgi:hypothetical protein
LVREDGRRSGVEGGRAGALRQNFGGGIGHSGVPVVGAARLDRDDLILAWRDY